MEEKEDRRKVAKPKNKMFQMRCRQEFLDAIDELRVHLDMSRPAMVEFAVSLFPALVEKLKENEDGNS